MGRKGKRKDQRRMAHETAAPRPKDKSLDGPPNESPNESPKEESLDRPPKETRERSLNQSPKEPLPKESPKEPPTKEPPKERSLDQPPKERWLDRIKKKWYYLAAAGAVGILGIVADCEQVFLSSTTAPAVATPSELNITAAARLPTPNLAPTVVDVKNGPYELRAVDVMCDWVSILTEGEGHFDNNASPSHGPRIAGVSPNGGFPVECPMIVLLDNAHPVVKAVIAIDTEFSVTGRTGRYYARFEFTLERDRQDRRIWTLSHSENGPVSKRSTPFGVGKKST